MSFETTVSAFAKALDDPSAATPPMTRGRMDAPDARRFAVYRNNVAVGLIGALEARYPVSRRIAGEDLFRAMARAFVRAHRPRSPVMIAYGGEFPEFMAEYLARGEAEPAFEQIVIARSEATRRSRGLQGARRLLDCFASLAMTIVVRSNCITLPPVSPTWRGWRTPGSGRITPKMQA